MNTLDFHNCNICPRNCNTDRTKGNGICKTGVSIRIARVGLHEWEEPCISYGKGSGTVFFSGCNLKCVFCQNREISYGLKGIDVSADTLADEFIKLQQMGASNINLVTPTHFVPQILDALKKVKPLLNIPVCYNCGGYEKPESLEMLKGYVDIFMPDVKYFSSEYSKKYSGAADYFSVASKALEKMLEMVGYPVINERGEMEKGVLVRHLVLPGLYRDSIKILEYLAEKYDSSKMVLSIMSQYFPTEKCSEYPEINRKLTTLEYKKVVDRAYELGFVNSFVQQKSSADSTYVPDFDYERN